MQAGAPEQGETDARTPPSPIAIARRLIACRSVTPADDGALPYLRDLLKTAGFSAEIVSFSAPGLPTIDNLYARIGTQAPHIAFAGHTDVVPVGDTGKWRFDPFSGEIADGMIWGRGACDMKGGVAAAVAAALRAVARGDVTGSISFLITGDEEGPAVNGTVKLLEWARAKGEHFDHCILGEPTSREKLGDMMKNGRRGSLSGRLTLLGKQGHVAYPHLARNPVRGLAPILGALQAPPLDMGTSSFEASNLEIVSVDVGNHATNVIPGELRLVFNIRFNDLWSPDSLSAEIERRIAHVTNGAGYELKFDSTNAVAFLTPSGPFTTILIEAVRDITGRQAILSTSGGTSDARFIKAACPVVELGLVGQTMHGVDERVSVEDIESLSRIYERALALYFAAFATN
jgi:succinyl-diaminopimelate desuccinylase